MRQGLGLRPPRHRRKRVGLDLGAHCIYQARRQEGRCRSFEEVQAWVTERSQASSPGTVRLLVQTALSLQMLASKTSSVTSPVATNQPSKITAKGSSLSPYGQRQPVLTNR